MNSCAKQDYRKSSKKRKQKSPLSSSSTSRRSRPRNSPVLQSPRMLSFPYHNDSTFLPIVEQHRQSEKERLLSIRSGSITSSSTTTTVASKRKRVKRQYSLQSSTPPPPPSPSKNDQNIISSSCSHSWIKKTWKSLRRRLSFSTRPLTAIVS